MIFSAKLIMATNREVFNQIADSWYRLRHWSRFSSELEDVARRWESGRLLNVGCAHGPDFLPFKGAFELWGIDYSEQMIEFAQKYAAKFKLDVNLAVADAVSLPFPDGFFDYSIAVAVYHHISGAAQRQQAFRELRRVLCLNGEAYITVWNRWQPRFMFKGAEVNVPWRSKGKVLNRYHYLYSYAEIQKRLSEAGFEVISIQPEAAYHLPVKMFSRNICALVRAV
jgi:tRNA (uracil-5-)-methyltransferase TRM9